MKVIGTIKRKFAVRSSPTGTNLKTAIAAVGSYCVFDGKQIAVVGEEMVKCGKRRVHCAA